MSVTSSGASEGSSSMMPGGMNGGMPGGMNDRGNRGQQNGKIPENMPTMPDFNNIPFDFEDIPSDFNQIPSTDDSSNQL